MTQDQDIILDVGSIVELRPAPPQSNNKPFYIYVLCDPVSHAVRYVGKTINPAGRLQSHMAPHDGSTAKMKWIADLRKRKQAPYMRIEQVVDPRDADRAERLMIAKHLAMGCDLTNDMGSYPAKVSSETASVGVGCRVEGTVYNGIIAVAWLEGLSVGNAAALLLGEAVAARAAAVPAPEPGEEGTS